MPIHLRFESTLNAPREVIWRFVTSSEGIRAEMRPYLNFSLPEGIRRLEDLDFRPGEVLYRSRMRLFGVLPIGTFHVTLLELTPNEGFIEESPMTGMRLWRHERRLVDAKTQGQTQVVDELTVVPRLGTALTRWFLRMLFEHRHRVLREKFDEGR